MIDNAKIYVILISCPSDVQKEIQSIKEVIEEINQQTIARNRICFQVKHWSRDVDTEIGQEAQQYINENLVDDCDILVSIFKTRFGSPTKNAASGTEEEINKFVVAKKKCFLYFARKSDDIDLVSLDLDQMQKVRSFRGSISDKSLYRLYDSLQNLKEVFKSDFNVYLNKMLSENKLNPDKSESADIEIKESEESNLIAETETQPNELWDSISEIVEDLESATSKLQELTTDTYSFTEDTQQFTANLQSLKSNPAVKPILIKAEMEKYARRIDDFSDKILNLNETTKNIWKRIYVNSEIILKAPAERNEDKAALNNFYYMYLASIEPINTLKNEISKGMSQFVMMKGFQKDITKATNKMESNFLLFQNTLSDFIINSQRVLDNYEIKREEV